MTDVMIDMVATEAALADALDEQLLHQLADRARSETKLNCQPTCGIDPPARFAAWGSGLML